MGRKPFIHGRDHLPGGEDPIPNLIVSGEDGPWIYVGTTGVDGVDSLLTVDSPPFQNSWTNALGDEAPVSFLLTFNGWVHLRGGFAGGADNTTVFTLPVGYRPPYRQEMVIPTGSDVDYATCVVETDGTVVYETTV
jgi:hypothetical protein